MYQAVNGRSLSDLTDAQGRVVEPLLSSSITGM